MLEVCVPPGTPADNYTGTVVARATASSKPDAQPAPITLVSMPVHLEVWPIGLPSLNDTEAFGTAFTFGSTGQWRLEDW